MTALATWTDVEQPGRVDTIALLTACQRWQAALRVDGVVFERSRRTHGREVEALGEAGMMRTTHMRRLATLRLRLEQPLRPRVDQADLGPLFIAAAQPSLF